MIDANNDRIYTDRYLLFKKKKDITSYLAHEINPEARFNACDHIDYSTDNREYNGVSHISLTTLTIKTNAFLSFSEGDYLYDVKGEKTWLVEKVTVADEGSQKRIRMRPRKITYLQLVGEED